MKAMFEPENLANASPATVSRAGIIYVSDVELGWKPPVVSWLNTKLPYIREILTPLFDTYIDRILAGLRMQYRPLVYNETACTLAAMRTLMDGCLPDAGSTNIPAHKVRRIFLYCLTWSLGGLLDPKDRPAFDADVRAVGGDDLPPKTDDDTLFEYTVNDAGEWVHWSQLVQQWQYPKNTERPKFAQLNIPTLDSTRFDALLSKVASLGKSSLLVGGPGTSKTTIINMFMAKFSAEEMASKVITFSSLTTPGIFQTTMEAAVEKRQGRTFGPPGGKKMTVFIDDISMPFINAWGDQVRATSPAVHRRLKKISTGWVETHCLVSWLETTFCSLYHLLLAVQQT
jgi:dynein heavy chain